MNIAIIAAAGQGTRLGGKRRKQFLELAGKPIVFHTLQAFEHCDAIQEIVLVLPAEDFASFLSLAQQEGLRKLTKVVPGGATRAQSVLHGLQAVREATAEIVAVHDGVRPFVTPAEIARTVEAATMEGAAVLVSTPVDTIKEVVDGTIVRTLDRSRLRNALTPQCFRYKLLRQAYEALDVLDAALTDDSSLVERLGARIVAIEGSPHNIKITRPEDIAIGEAILKSWSQF
jgi:2-C-methyl-D-erythritol 4-phosphate cytidylyltransferase